MQAVPMEKSINNSDWANEDTQLIDVNDLPEQPDRDWETMFYYMFQ